MLQHDLRVGIPRDPFPFRRELNRCAIRSPSIGRWYQSTRFGMLDCAPCRQRRPWPQGIQDLKAQGINVLGRRHIECFLYDDEVLAALCVSVGKDTEVGGLLTDKADALVASIARGNASDDVKSAAGQI